MSRYPRDMGGYGPEAPAADWPGGARIAISLVLNYEEGGENCILHGDAASEAFLSEIVGAQPWPGQRHWNMESIYEYGARAGFWRLYRLMRDLPPQLAPEGGKPLGRWQGWGASALAAGVAALVAGLGTAALMRPAPLAEAPVYEQASGDASDLPRLTVTFAPEARLSEVAALLQAQDLLIVDGPGALGLYRLELPPGADAAAVAEALLQAPIVTTVELPE